MAVYTVTNYSSTTQQVASPDDGTMYNYSPGATVNVTFTNAPTFPNCFTVKQGSTVLQTADSSFTANNLATQTTEQNVATEEAPATALTSSASEASHIFKTSACTLQELDVINTSGAAGYIMLFDSATVPADGAVTPLKVWAIAINGSLNRSWPHGLSLSNGLVLVFSSTGPLTKTGAASGFFSVDTR